MLSLAVAWVLGLVLGWLMNSVYQTGVETKQKGWKPLNQRGERLRLFR